jgi:hypothetical protein
MQRGEPMRAEKRHERRRQVAHPALMIDDSGAVIDVCTILDMAAAGARLKLAGKVSLPPTFWIILSPHSNAPRRQCRVAWTNGNDIGIRWTINPPTACK